MLLRRVSHLTAFGRRTPYSPSWRACDYADKPDHENQRSSTTDALSQLGRGIIRQSALHRRAQPEAGDSEPQECAVLQNTERSGGGRSLYEFDPHLPTQWSQSVRLPHGTAASRRRVKGKPGRVDAVELSGDAGADHQTGGRVTFIYDGSVAWPERIDSVHADGTF
jgi:hypothetical protein